MKLPLLTGRIFWLRDGLGTVKWIACAWLLFVFVILLASWCHEEATFSKGLAWCSNLAWHLWAVLCKGRSRGAS